MRGSIAALVAVLAIGWSAPAFAQQTSSTTEKLKFPKWDAGGGLGLLMAGDGKLGGQEGSGCYCGGENFALAENIDFGRYFTQHLKVDGGVMWTNERYFYSNNFTYLQPFPLTSTSRSVKPTTFSAAFTYQFLENVFAHPYVSAGVQVTSFSEESQTFTYNSNFSTPPIRSSSSRNYTEVRPFVAAGYKSYFNSRVYLRSEIMAAFDSDGFSHSTARLSVGFDF